jgi:hypothetical protein
MPRYTLLGGAILNSSADNIDLEFWRAKLHGVLGKAQAELVSARLDRT